MFFFFPKLWRRVLPATFPAHTHQHTRTGTSTLAQAHLREHSRTSALAGVHLDELTCTSTLAVAHLHDRTCTSPLLACKHLQSMLHDSTCRASCTRAHAERVAQKQVARKNTCNKLHEQTRTSALARANSQALAQSKCQRHRATCAEQLAQRTCARQLACRHRQLTQSNLRRGLAQSNLHQAACAERLRRVLAQGNLPRTLPPQGACAKQRHTCTSKLARAHMRKKTCTTDAFVFCFLTLCSAPGWTPHSARKQRPRWTSYAAFAVCCVMLSGRPLFSSTWAPKDGFTFGSPIPNNWGPIPSEPTGLACQETVLASVSKPGGPTEASDGARPHPMGILLGNLWFPCKTTKQGVASRSGVHGVFLKSLSQKWAAGSEGCRADLLAHPK